MKGKRRVFLILFLLVVILQLATVRAITLTPAVQSVGSVHSLAQPIDLLFPSVDVLVRQADLVARAQVISSTSQWNKEHTLIETAHTLAVRYTVAGEGAPEAIVYTDGGFLPEEGVGMRSSHTAAFTSAEEVVVFLRKRSDGYQTVRGETGKFTIFNTAVSGSDLHQQQSLEQLIQSIQNAAIRQGLSLTLPENWRSYEPTTFVRQPTSPNQPWNDPKWPGDKPKVKAQVNINTTQIGTQSGSAEQFLQAIKNALRTWSIVESTEFTLLYDGSSTATSTGFNSKSEILFMPRGLSGQLGQAQIWYTNSGAIIEADLWINDDYALDATGAPQANEIDVESVVLHELGHWAPLGHVDLAEAVMYPVLGNGVRKAVLASDDINRLQALYPCPNIPCIDPVYASDVTPTQTAVSTPVNSATPTPTASALSTPSPTSAITQVPTTTPVATAAGNGTPRPSDTPTPTITLIATQEPTPIPTTEIMATVVPTTISGIPLTTLFFPIIMR